MRELLVMWNIVLSIFSIIINFGPGDSNAKFALILLIFFSLFWIRYIYLQKTITKKKVEQIDSTNLSKRLMLFSFIPTILLFSLLFLGILYEQITAQH